MSIGLLSVLCDISQNAAAGVEKHKFAAACTVVPPSIINVQVP